MTDGSTTLDADGYTRLFEQEHPRLVAYARTLTGNSWLAEDLVAEAHFRIWRRLRAGHVIDNVPAYLTTTVRNLSTAVGRANREIPQDPEDGPAWPEESRTAEDPTQRVAYVDLLAKVMEQLPRRWVKALWLAEAEDQPLEAVGRQIGAGSGATAVLLHRAREGMRQAFLRSMPGAPSRASCGGHWDRMPAHVRGVASAKQADGLESHVSGCTDCRARMDLLMRANTRLPALVGPALLALLASGAAKFLVPLAGAGTAAAAAAGQQSGQQAGAGAAKSVRHLLRGRTGPAAATVAGVGVVAVAGVAVAAGIALTSGKGAVPQQRAAAPAASAAPGQGSGGGAGGGDGRGGASGSDGAGGSSGSSGSDGSKGADGSEGSVSGGGADGGADGLGEDGRVSGEVRSRRPLHAPRNHDRHGQTDRTTTTPTGPAPTGTAVVPPPTYPSASGAPTATPTPTLTGWPTVDPTSTPTGTPTLIPTPTEDPTAGPTGDPTPTLTPTPTGAPSPTTTPPATTDPTPTAPPTTVPPTTGPPTTPPVTTSPTPTDLPTPRPTPTLHCEWFWFGHLKVKICWYQ
ncbi:RNA polymerase sigma factor [Streptomyces varsoviensis]|uniref:RNA polymerase sigma factor n=1 Tax=Streptomyces varsoviensis TaxID=67373 RepID=UPI00069241D0|nr:sigma-70 family RNA polymerase sigma factor [Streptomyces varsoviensis]